MQKTTYQSKYNTATEDNRRKIGPHTLLPADHPVSQRLKAAGIVYWEGNWGSDQGWVKDRYTDADNKLWQNQYMGSWEVINPAGLDQGESK